MPATNKRQRSQRDVHAPPTTRKQAVVIGLLLALCSAILVLVPWLIDRSQPDTAHWGQTTAVVTAHRRGLLARGTATIVHARYTVNDVVHEADVLSARNELSAEGDIAPADTPGVGAVIPVKYDPADPRASVMAGRERAPLLNAWWIGGSAIMALLAMVCWFSPVRR